MPAMRRVYLMRHADVSYADAAGRPVAVDDVSLTDEGRLQARAVRDALARVSIDRAIVSGLPRAVETAAVILDGRSLRFETRTELQEIRPGRLDHLPPERLEAEFTGALHRAVEPGDRFLNGETWGELQARALPCFRQMVSEPGFKHLLVVAHGGVNRVLLLDALGLGLSGLGKIEQDPACLNILDVDRSGRVVVRLLNHTAYDPAKETLLETTMERLYRSFKR
jgi:broad specificity phosphatase PhoE